MGETFTEDDARRLLELEQEQWRRQCRADLVAFATEALTPFERVPARHHRLLCDRLMALTRDRLGKRRLMILAPPGCGKTIYTSRIFPAWFFATYRARCIIGVSHIASLAETNSGYVQRFISDNADVLGYRLRNDDRTHWFTTNDGEYLAAGTEGTTRGHRADLLLVDDPIKNSEAAESLNAREKLWESYHSDLLPRLKPDGVVIMIGTPLHEDDLLCRLIREQADEWAVLRLPAFADAGDDALGRAEDEPLWADQPDYGYARRLYEIRAAAERQGRLRDFYAQYQGRPRPPEGAMFRPAEMPVVDRMPEIIEWVRAWDLAASSGKGDWTVGLLLGRVVDQPYEFIVLDVRRGRWAPEEVRRTVRAVTEADGFGTKVWLPRDPAQAGVDQVESYVRLLVGYPVEAERMSGSKEVRADAVASQANIGQVALLRAAWNGAFIEELASFPRGVHDDQVDALSLAFSKLAQSDLGLWWKM
jgi:predicted phage terminase large subunit-like protein